MFLTCYYTFLSFFYEFTLEDEIQTATYIYIVKLDKI